MAFMTKLRAIVGFALVANCVLTWLPQSARATPPFELLGDSLSMGGQQARTMPGGASAAYFNPALLTEVPASADVGFVFLAQRIGISPQARPGGTDFDVPVGQNIDNARTQGELPFENYPLPTQELEIGRQADPTVGKDGLAARPRQGASTGRQNVPYILFALSLKAFKDRLAVGVTGLIPLPNFTTLGAFFSDEREQYFSNSLHSELYGDRLTAPSIAFGGGLKVLENLSIGAGATLIFKAPAMASTHVADVTKLDELGIDLKAPVKVWFSPHFGASATMLDKRLRLSAVAHAPSSMDLNVGFKFLIGSASEKSSSLPFSLYYMPWRASVGGGFDLVHTQDKTLTLAGTVTYARWSTYKDRHAERATPGYRWYDTLTPTVGVRYRTGALSTLLDVSYSPSPVPLQTGRTNYVDNNRLTAVTGIEYGFELFGLNSHIGMQLQAHYMMERQQSKLPTPTDPSGRNRTPQLVTDEVPDDATVGGSPVAGRSGLQTNNAGWPGFGSQGIIAAASVYYRLTL